MFTMARVKDVYLVRHGESTYNQWRKQSYTTCFCTCMMGHCCDPLIRDAPLSAKGEKQVRVYHDSNARRLKQPAPTSLLRPLHPHTGRWRNWRQRCKRLIGPNESRPSWYHLSLAHWRPPSEVNQEHAPNAPRTTTVDDQPPPLRVRLRSHANLHQVSAISRVCASW